MSRHKKANVWRKRTEKGKRILHGQKHTEAPAKLKRVSCLNGTAKYGIATQTVCTSHKNFLKYFF
jgi:hypothetical protein